jgi:hypothetical protein
VYPQGLPYHYDPLIAPTKKEYLMQKMKFLLLAFFFLRILGDLDI